MTCTATAAPAAASDVTHASPQKVSRIMEETSMMLQLESWARNQGILPTARDFACPNYDDCQASLGQRPPDQLLNRERTCLMSNVGRLYYEQAFRLVTVGMDHRDRDNWGDFKKRQSGIENWFYHEKHRFNEHYAGVIRTAAAVMGRTGEFCLANCLTTEKKWGGQCFGSSNTCLLLRIAQPNLVKCVAAKGADCKATENMRRNCSRFLHSELELLDPQLVVFHGVDSKEPFLSAVREAGQTIAQVDDATPTGQKTVLYEMRGRHNYLVLFLAHPSRYQLAAQWASVVEPTLKWLRSHEKIPK
jgi:hypothetical protein